MLRVFINLILKKGIMEVAGNTTNPKAHMRIQLWGCWNYIPMCEQVIDWLETKFENIFQYHIMIDPTNTGNFECLVFPTAECSGEGTAVFSKQKVGKFPHEDEATLNMFLEEVKKHVPAWGIN